MHNDDDPVATRWALGPAEFSRCELGVKLWRWRFIAPGPHLTMALHVGEILRAATTRISCDRGTGLLPEGVHGGGENGHCNAFWLPGDEDGDGLIDHAWVYCESGLSRETIEALTGVRYLRVNRSRHELVCDWMSPRVEGGPFGPARIWRAATAYVTPRWRLSKTGRERPTFTPEAQLISEIARRNLPAVVSVAWEAVSLIGEEPVLASAFLTSRRKSGSGAQPPGDAVTAFPTVTFTEPVLGPLAFGFGAHFGLGQVLPLQL